MKMGFSVNTNTGAMAALQSLNVTNRGLDQTQSRINTGLSVGSTKDDSAKFTVAQKLRGEMGGLSAVSSSLSRAKSTTDVAISGAEQISDVLNQMKAKATEASDAGIDKESRAAIAKDFKALRDQISTIIDSSSFNGTNLLKAGKGDVSALMSTDTSSASLKVDNVQLDKVILEKIKDPRASGTAAPVGPGSDDFAAADLFVDDAGYVKAVAAKAANNGQDGIASTADDEAAVTAVAGVGKSGAEYAADMVKDLDVLGKVMNEKLSTLGAASRQIETQSSFVSKLSDTIEGGIGNLVDADLAKESAKLQALQTKQQLGLQALSIANQAPQSIMSLFR
jgi:flagellin